MATIRLSSSTFGPFFEQHTLLFGIQVDYETTETPQYRRVHTPKTWKKYRQDLIGRKLYENVSSLIQQSFPSNGFDNAEDCVDSYLTKNIMEAYEAATPEVI